jgi:hypothetical protein
MTQCRWQINETWIWSNGGIILTWEKPKYFDRNMIPVPLWPPQTLCGLVRDWACASRSSRFEVNRHFIIWYLQTIRERVMFVRICLTKAEGFKPVMILGPHTAVAAGCHDNRIAHTVHYVILIRNLSSTLPPKSLKPLSIEHIFIHKESDLTFF